MSDFWSKFKGVFVQPDPNVVNQPKQPEQKTTPPTPILKEEPTAATTPSRGVATTPLATVGNGTVSDKFMQALFGAIESANLDGFDYFEYKLSLKNLANMPMDEPTRYKSAYAMATTMGATLEKLTSSAQHYLDILKNENIKFSQAAENQRTAQVGNKQSQVENMEAVILQKAEQIKRLTDEIGQHRQEVDKLKDDIAQATVKVAQTQQDFAATYQSLVGQIDQDIVNMKNYLK